MFAHSHNHVICIFLYRHPLPQLNDAQRWVLSELSCTVSLVNTEMAAFNWRPCADGVAAFVVNKFCDVFIEFTKTGLVADNQTTTPAQKVCQRSHPFHLKIAASISIVISFLS